MGNKHIENNGIYNEGVINGDVHLNKDTQKKNKWENLSKMEKTGILTTIAGFIITVVLLIIPSDSQSNNITNNNQSIVIHGNNNGNIINKVDNSKTEYNTTINKIDNLLNEYTVNIKGKNQQEQKEINTKLFMVNKAKEIAKKRLPSSLQNEECKNKAKSAANLLNYEIDTMYKVCDEIF